MSVKKQHKKKKGQILGKYSFFQTACFLLNYPKTKKSIFSNLILNCKKYNTIFIYILSKNVKNMHNFLTVLILHIFDENTTKKKIE